MIEFTVEKVLEGVKASALFVACLVLIYQFFGAYATLKVSSVLIFYYFIPQPKLFATLAAFWILLPFLRRSIQAHSLYQTYEGYVPCEEIRGKLKPWDLIEFERPTKRIEGTDTVYHWVNTPGSKVAKINTDSLKDAADGANCRINNLEKFAKFHNLTRREDSEIYATIVSYLRLSKSGTLKYNELTENCEHFATFCIFGKRISIQADFEKLYPQRVACRFECIFDAESNAVNGFDLRGPRDLAVTVVSKSGLFVMSHINSNAFLTLNPNPSIAWR
ncbi:Lecithin retinol acyltransferase [Folsomia candida]|uniref:Lecithin retinol acyltransferase n=1 Tax=Folsomia candida TaxID=158441 RepID=A0A226EGI7_FOLCA|nr:Lecithin retinol acyltransferase [Folsomia candida]